MENPFDILSAKLDAIQAENAELKRLILQVLQGITITEAGTADDALMTYEQAAKYLNKGKSTLAAYVKDGKIPHIKEGHNIRFRKSDLDNWLSEKTVRVVDIPTYKQSA